MRHPRHCGRALQVARCGPKDGSHLHECSMEETERNRSGHTRPSYQQPVRVDWPQGYEDAGGNEESFGRMVAPVQVDGDQLVAGWVRPADLRACRARLRELFEQRALSDWHR